MRATIFLLTIALFNLPLASADFASKSAEAVEARPTIEHTWVYAAAQFDVDLENLNSILDDSSAWLTEHGFTSIEPLKDIGPLGEEDLPKLKWFAKMFVGQGRMLIRLEPSGDANLIVESYQKPPQNARFRAKAAGEYKLFALFMASHKANLQGLNLNHLSELIDSKIRYLQAKATKAEQAVAPNRSPAPNLKSTSSVRGSED